MKKTTGRANARPNGVLRTHNSLAAVCSNVSGTLFKCFRIQCSSPPEYAPPGGIGPIIGPEDDPDDPEGEPEGPQNPEDPEDDPDERPFTTLAQIFQSKFWDTLQPESRIGDRMAFEFIFVPVWYPVCFEQNPFTGGKRIILAHPERPFRDKTIMFSCSWRGENGKKQKVNFLVQFEKEEVFYKYLKKLFKKEINEIGLTERKCLHEWVLIAGDWEDTGNTKYRDYKCKFVNDRQIYIPR